MHPESAESAVIRTYLDWMFDLPWAKTSKDNLDLKRAKSILNEDHYGLEKVKERILEYLAVRKLTNKTQGPILCFVGPPGVGKTSLGKSIARALDRKFVRISLGGVRDEAEIRGHRRTYVGALPGRIIQELKNAGTNNPVFMLDEVDKIGTDFRGDPSSALLEVLDPEQNNSFTDHYLDVPFDLSKVLFITTANLLDPIQPAFRDRMEVIELPRLHRGGEAADRPPLPDPQADRGERPDAKPDRVHRRGASRTSSPSTPARPGCATWSARSARICRKVAHKVAEGRSASCTRSPAADRGELRSACPSSSATRCWKRDRIGVATGMAWTAAGGDILFVEATLMPGKGELILTGSLGDVMKESAQRRPEPTSRPHAAELGIATEDFDKNDIHIHVPEGAIPKDGPSAGITMATALISAFTGIAGQARRSP